MIRKSGGFSIVEILVVLSITAILFTTGLAAYNQFGRRQTLTQSAKTLKTDMRFVQGKALSGEKECSACFGPNSACGDADDYPLEGWFMSFSNSPPSYTYYGKCGNNTFGSRTINLPDNVSFFPPLPPLPLQFKPLAGGVINDATITLTAFDDTQQITITGSGEIN